MIAVHVQHRQAGEGARSPFHGARAEVDVAGEDDDIGFADRGVNGYGVLTPDFMMQIGKYQ
jgi:hypothetical protein